MSSGVAYRMIRTAEELEALKPAWHDLWHRDPNATPFQSPAWLIPWWHSFGNGNLRAVTISNNGDLTGILPFYRYIEDFKADARLMLLGVGTTDYLDGVFAPECRDEHIRTALNLLCKDEDWGVLEVSQMRRSSRLLDAMKRSGNGYSIFETESCSQMSAVRISDLPQKIRRNAMYYRNRASRRGALELSLAEAATCTENFDILMRLHTERWRERGSAGMLADPRVQGWHREALPLLAQSCILRLYTLRLGGSAVAIIYSLVDPPNRIVRSQYFYLTGYSTRHSDLRPGTISIAMAVESALNCGVQAVDMLRGDEEYKKLWHLDRHPTYGISLHRTAVADMSLQQVDKAAA